MYSGSLPLGPEPVQRVPTAGRDPHFDSGVSFARSAHSPTPVEMGLAGLRYAPLL